VLDAIWSKPDDEALPMMRIFQSFIKAEYGATAIEYSLIAAGISIVIVVAVNSIGSTLNTTFTSVSTALK
jgi:pilus assembly protein Flp/PilA